MTGSEQDDFDRLGAAVARVLRDAFETAEEMRRQGAADAGVLSTRVGSEIEQSLRTALELQSLVRRDADEVVASVEGTVASAKTAVDEILAAARREADELRAESAAQVEELVENARATLDQAKAVVAAERIAFERDLGRVVADLQKAVDSIRSDASERRRAALDKTREEAASILRQARMHHRAVADEVDRMIEAAAAEAAALRKAAREDALRINEQVAGVVDLRRRARPRRAAG